MLHHVSLETRPDGIAACREFYRLLGFRPVPVPRALAGRAEWLERAGTQIHLLSAEEPVVPPRGHHALVVSGYDAAVEALRAAGHAVEPRAEHWGAARSYVRDPAGHLVELMAAPPG